MNWDALGAIAELLGAAGVVASLVYLAIQIRQSSRIAKVTAQEAAVAGMRDVQKSFLLDPELNRVLMQSTENWRGSSLEDQSRLANTLFQILKTWESIHLHYLRGLLEEDTWRGWNALFRHYINSPGWRLYWELRQDVFSGAFREYVESSRTDANIRHVGRFLEGSMGGSASDVSEPHDEMQ